MIAFRNCLHLAELDRRGLCVALGYSSLFAYCTEALGFCKSSAGRRIAAARVCGDYPEAFPPVAKGELQLSVLCALRPHSNTADDEFRVLLEEVRALLSHAEPKGDLLTVMRRGLEALRSEDVRRVMRHSARPPNPL